MKAYIITFTAVLLFFTKPLAAQYARFPASGIIEYEKTINMYALINKMINKSNESFYRAAQENYKKTQPQFKKVRSTLSFTGNRTIYTPVSTTENAGFFSNEPALSQPNIIYTDLNTRSSITQKSVFEQTFSVRDSVRKINWKITNETREIAGYPCRRANALIMDSIYVVAFYSDKIPVSGGPESFTGLPGMILGVALPHENITWFATKVTDTPVSINTVVPPKKGKATSYSELISTLSGALKKWGDYAHGYLKTFLL